MVPACAGARLTHNSFPGQLTGNVGSLNFANVQVGNSQAQSVTLTNSGGTGLTVSQATLTGTGFTLSGLTLPLTLVAGQSATFSVAFAPQSAGSERGNLAFASNASNPAMNLPLSGNTPLVAITVNPVSYTHLDNVDDSLAYYIALKKAGVPVEMHLYAQGGHAFGLRHTKLPVTGWPQLVETWLGTIGMIPE